MTLICKYFKFPHELRQDVSCFSLFSVFEHRRFQVSTSHLFMPHIWPGLASKQESKFLHNTMSYRFFGQQYDSSPLFDFKSVQLRGLRMIWDEIICQFNSYRRYCTVFSAHHCWTRAANIIAVARAAFSDLLNEMPCFSVDRLFSKIQNISTLLICFWKGEHRSQIFSEHCQTLHINLLHTEAKKKKWIGTLMESENNKEVQHNYRKFRSFVHQSFLHSLSFCLRL